MKNKTIQRLLIANRGEIAVRIIETAQKMGIHCIAIYSDADANAMHVLKANEAWHVGPSIAKESYLNVEAVLTVAKQAKADAIHPGYGFLSENAQFAQSIIEAGLIWIGPPVDAIKAMGSKSESKKIMEQANVPLVPGYHGDNQDTNFLSEQIKNIGFPVLIKASAGGGGKGMRVVEHETDITAAIEGAKREGLNSFGDDKLLAEKYITRPRHVEIQVFLDEQGNGVYLFERDCSIQRRHQKVVEEAPAPDFPLEHRTAMGKAALKAAHAIQYVGAGTVEFLYDPTQTASPFYFMEMNTRLQVEHPVTEMITGQDLVAWQIQVAQGEPLPLTQDALQVNGHSMEVRIYAEDPDNDFLPTTGQLDKVYLPTLSSNVRLDTGVQQGGAISPYYDPMISKLIVWGATRAACLKQLQVALKEYQVFGVTTNLPYLRRITQVEDFKTGKVSTQFIPEHEASLQSNTSISDEHIIAATCRQLLTRSNHSQQDATSPWQLQNSFRLNQPPLETIKWHISTDETLAVTVNHISEHHWQFNINENQYQVRATLLGHVVNIDINGTRRCMSVYRNNDDFVVIDDHHESTLSKYQGHYETSQQQAGDLSAPMNGTIIQVDAKQGAKVQQGDVLIIMEAMKMEHAIKAPYEGTIKTIHFNQGDLVDEGAVLIELDELQSS